MPAPTTNFVSGTTIESSWLNKVDKITNIILDSSVDRPTQVEIGTLFFDTTLSSNGKPIWWNGFYWVDSNGVVV